MDTDKTALGRDRDRLEEIIRLTAEVASVGDLDALLDRILSCARRLLHADAGSVFIIEGDRLRFGCAQNDMIAARAGTGDGDARFADVTLPLTTETIAGYTALTGNALNIPDVHALAADLPYRFSADSDRRLNYRSCSMLTVPLRTSRGRIIGVLQMINALDAAGRIVAFSSEDALLVQYFGSSAAVAIERAAMTRDLVLRMIGMAELRDPTETGPHANRVAAYAVELYEHWATSRCLPQATIGHECDMLRTAAMLHDVGKVAISDSILRKPGRLTPEEYAIMKEHTFLGARLFAGARSDLDDAAAAVALCHHENWDGTGYPGFIDPVTGMPLPGGVASDGRARGRRGEEIPVFARAVKVADVYDALCSRRSYKDAIPEAEVRELIRGDSGKAFDPDMVEALTSRFDTLRRIAARYPS